MFSSAVDKAQLRLAAAKALLRLSRQWDHKVPVDVFYLATSISQYDFPQLRKSFLSKVHQYIKERVLDAKYACAFLLGLDDYHTPEYEGCKLNLLEVVQACQQVKLHQLSVQPDMNLLVGYPEYIIFYLVHALAHDPSCPNIEEYEDAKAFGPIYWRLHLLLSALIGEDGAPHAVPGMRKESFKTVMSIFCSIKCSQDLVDETKTNTLHAICDIGILITERLAQDQVNISGTPTVPLPAQLYRRLEDDQNENTMDTSEKAWLGCENVLAYFEALVREEKDKVDSVEDKMIIDEIDEHGNEVPLGKIIKILKSQGQKRTGKKLKEAPSSVNVGNDDVLGLANEINLDSQGRLDQVENSKQKKHLTDMKEIDGKLVDLLTPKRKRSVSKNRSRFAKGCKYSDGLLLHSAKMQCANRSLENKPAKEKKTRVESTGTDMVVSSLRNRNPAAKGKDTDKHPAEEDFRNPKKSDNADSTKKTSESGSLNGSLEKRKLGDMPGLAKCPTRLHDVDLVGCRIKVWWPLDKQFYEGVVQSYDSGKTQHEILYDDGDAEVLTLSKEKWRLIDNDDPPTKRQKHGRTEANQAQSKTTGTSRRLQNKPEQQKKLTRSSLSERKTKAKGLSDNTIRKASGGKKSVEVSSAYGVNYLDSSKDIAQSESDGGVNSGSSLLDYLFGP